MLKNTETSFGTIAKAFHWIIFLLVAVMLICGFFMDDFPDSMKPLTYMLHKSTGLLILGLMVLRLIWHWMNKAPTFPATMPHWEKIAARFMHGTLYIVLLAMPLDGWIMSTAAGRIPSFYGLFSLPFPGIEVNKELAGQLADFHEIFAYVLLGLIVLHILASFKHHFIEKDDILTRMMPMHKNKN